MKIKKLDDTYKPSFCWDRNWTIGEIKTRLKDANEFEKFRLIGWIMREGTFNEIWSLLTPSEISRDFQKIIRWLGKKKNIGNILLMSGKNWEKSKAL